MRNFLDFVSNDVEVKKTFLSSLPTKTKTNIKKYNLAVDEFIQKYTSYKESVFRYINAKNDSLRVREAAKDLSAYDKKIEDLEKVRNIFNPLNTSYEKMGFDELIYRMSNYYVFNSESIDSIINEFIDKFNTAGISLKSSDFDYTYYVHKYMDVFLEVRNHNKTQDDLNRTFEEIYWANPDIISHIEVNFRKLINKYMKKFDAYIIKRKKEYSKDFGINNYRECMEQLTKEYLARKQASEEGIGDIVEKALNKEFDISQYLETSKFRKSAYSSFLDENIDITDNNVMSKMCDTLTKLSNNLEEYNGYLKLEPLITDFKKKYSSLKDQPSSNQVELKTTLNTIKKQEVELDKLNKKIFRGNDDKILKMESISRTKQLYDLYKKYDEEYFKYKVLSVLNANMSISDVFDLYYAFSGFKKLTIQKVYKLNTYNEVIQQASIFDNFAKDPTNIIVKGLAAFEENNIPRIIANKYKLNNIRIYENDITFDNITTLNNKISLITRIYKINLSITSVEKIWFMVNAKKIIEK